MEKERFELFVEAFNRQFLAHSLIDGLRASLFLQTITPETYALLARLAAPQLPEEITFETMVVMLRQHYQPGGQVIMERFRFYSAYQFSDETVEGFIDRLKQLSTGCEFGSSLFDELRDRLVVGIRDVDIQTRLLKAEQLTFETACDLAKSAQTPQPEVKSKAPTPKLQKQHSTWLFRSRSSSPKVHDAKQEPPRPRSESPTNKHKAKISFKPTKKVDFWTGLRNKMTAPPQVRTSRQPARGLCNCIKCRRNLPFNYFNNRLLYCRNCGGRGHFTAACKIHTEYSAEQERLRESTPPQIKRTPSFNSRQVLFDQNEAVGLRPFQVNVSINDRIVGMKIDNRAARSFISHDTYRKYFGEVPLKQTYTNHYEEVLPGQKLPLYGVIEAKINSRHREMVLDLTILDCTGSFQPILGRDWLEVIFPTRLLMLVD